MNISVTQKFNSYSSIDNKPSKIDSPTCRIENIKD